MSAHDGNVITAVNSFIYLFISDSIWKLLSTTFYKQLIKSLFFRFWYIWRGLWVKVSLMDSKALFTWDTVFSMHTMRCRTWTHHAEQWSSSDPGSVNLDADSLVWLCVFRGFVSGAWVQTDGSETLHPLFDRGPRPEAAAGPAQVLTPVHLSICPLVSVVTY